MHMLEWIAKIFRQFFIDKLSNNSFKRCLRDSADVTGALVSFRRTYAALDINHESNS